MVMKPSAGKDGVTVKSAQIPLIVGDNAGNESHINGTTGIKMGSVLGKNTSPSNIGSNRRDLWWSTTQMW